MMNFLWVTPEVEGQRSPSVEQSLHWSQPRREAKPSLSKAFMERSLLRGEKWRKKRSHCNWRTPQPFLAGQSCYQSGGDTNSQVSSFVKVFDELPTCFSTNQGDPQPNRGTQSLFHHSGYPTSLSPVSVEPRHCQKLPQKCPAREVEKCPPDLLKFIQPTSPTSGQILTSKRFPLSWRSDQSEPNLWRPSPSPESTAKVSKIIASHWTFPAKHLPTGVFSGHWRTPFKIPLTCPTDLGARRSPPWPQLPSPKLFVSPVAPVAYASILPVWDQSCPPM